MKKTLAVCVALVLVSLNFPNYATAKVVTPNAVKKKLLWSTEFGGKAGKRPVDFGFVYDFGYGNGWGNSEVQFYSRSKANASTDGKGKMVITAKRIPFDHPVNIRYCGLGCEYTSARFKTQGKMSFQYGRLEARIKNPPGIGTWPAFWLLGNDLGENPWPDAGEIDIMEGKGTFPNTILGTVHGPGYSGGQGISGSLFNLEPYVENYHVYAIEWKKNSIKWFIDDELFHEVTPASVSPNEWVFNKRYFLIMNLAMGGLFGGQTSESVTETKMYIDYIRYYSLDGVGSFRQKK
jgi:beta-glucanase (GH16 family)